MNDIFIMYMADQFVNAGLNDDQNPIYSNKSFATVAREYGATLATSLLTKGLSRMNYEGQKYFINYMKLMFSAASDKQCASYLFPERFRQTDAKEDQLNEMELLSKFSYEFIEQYLAFARKSMYAEVTESPLRREPTKSEVDFANNAFTLKFQEIYFKHPNNRAMDNYLENQTSTDYRAACDFGLVSLRAMLELEGNMQDWYLQYFVNQMN